MAWTRIPHPLLCAVVVPPGGSLSASALAAVQLKSVWRVSGGTQKAGDPHPEDACVLT